MLRGNHENEHLNERSRLFGGGFAEDRRAGGWGTSKAPSVSVVGVVGRGVPQRVQLESVALWDQG